MKKINWTNNTDIRLGFEVECIIRGGYHYRKFCEAIRETFNKLKCHIEIGSDGSINCEGLASDSRPVEIRTSPLPPKKSMEVLKAVFDIVNKYGLTNASCGLHVNISSAHRSKMRNFNPLPFLSSKLWDEILRKFSRKSNNYCRPILTVNRRRASKYLAFQALSNACGDKYRCVTLCNFGNGLSKSSRVEVRGFGNKNYTQKYDVIAEFVKRIERLFKLSCGNFPLTRTFSV
jgi:hypothetical protein